MPKLDYNKKCRCGRPLLKPETRIWVQTRKRPPTMQSQIDVLYQTSKLDGEPLCEDCNLAELASLMEKRRPAVAKQLEKKRKC